MRSYTRRYPYGIAQWLGVAVTLLLALIFEMLVVSGWVVYIWPQWLLLMVCYWTVRSPNLLPLSVIVLLGLLLDIIHVNVLGMHAIVLLVLVYALQKFSKRFRLFPVLQQAFWVMLITMAYQGALFGFQYWLQPETVQALFNPWRQLTILSSLLMWPLLQFLLNSLARRREPS